MRSGIMHLNRDVIPAITTHVNAASRVQTLVTISLLRVPMTAITPPRRIAASRTVPIAMARLAHLGPNTALAEHCVASGRGGTLKNPTARRKFPTVCTPDVLVSRIKQQLVDIKQPVRALRLRHLDIGIS